METQLKTSPKKSARRMAGQPSVEFSELGTDFSKWPSVKHFASWLGLCPNWKKTGGKVQSSKTRKGKNRAASALRLAAWSLVRIRETCDHAGNKVALEEIVFQSSPLR
jgi:transposase